MKFTSASSSQSAGSKVVQDLLEQIRPQVPPEEADWMLLFFTPHYEDEIEGIVERLSEDAPRATLLGCSAEGTIGAGRELQRSCSVSLLAGRMPGVAVRPFHFSQEQLDRLNDAEEWTDHLGLARGDTGTSLTVVFGDPFSFHIQRFLEKSNELLPGRPVVGGMASAAEGPGQNRLILGQHIHREGLVGTTLLGDFSARMVVSQGCRPIGETMVVTKGERNILYGLGGRPAVQQLTRTIQTLAPREVDLARQVLFVGRVINEYQPSFARGDFLIHTIIGLDQSSGALAIAGPVRVGSTVQFHIRDAECADEDLRSLLAKLSPSCADLPPSGALLFSCNGRGIRMWPEEGHDVGVLTELCGPIPAAGFFAAGEIGPIGGRNFIHGFTASIALLAPAGA